MSVLGLFAGVMSFLKLKNNVIGAVANWRHENTLRQEHRLQADIEREKLDVERMRVINEAQKIKQSDADSERQAKLELARIQSGLLQQERQNKTEILKTLIEKGHISEVEPAKFLAHLTLNHSDEQQGNHLSSDNMNSSF